MFDHYIENLSEAERKQPDQLLTMFLTSSSQPEVGEEIQREVISRGWDRAAVMLAADFAMAAKGGGHPNKSAFPLSLEGINYLLINPDRAMAEVGGPILLKYLLRGTSVRAFVKAMGKVLVDPPQNDLGQAFRFASGTLAVMMTDIANGGPDELTADFSTFIRSDPQAILEAIR